MPDETKAGLNGIPATVTMQPDVLGRGWRTSTKRGCEEGPTQQDLEGTEDLDGNAQTLMYVVNSIREMNAHSKASPGYQPTHHLHHDPHTPG